MRSASPLWIILALWGAGLGAAGQFGTYSLIFDRIAAQYPGHGPVVLGLIVSVVGLVGLVFGTTAGILVARAGYRRVLVASLAFGAVASVLEALRLPLSLLLPLRAMEGFSQLGIVVAAPVLIAQAAPLRWQGPAMTLWATFLAASFALTAALGVPLADARGPEALFAAHAIWMAVFAMLLARMLPRDVARAPDLPASLLRQHVEIYASPREAAPAFGFGCYTLVYVALLTYLPGLVGGPWRAALATAMPLATVGVSLTLGVVLLRRVPAFRVVQAGFALALTCTVGLLAVAGRPGMSAAVVLCLMGALGLTQGASFAAIPQLNVTPQQRARAAGAVAQLGNLGTTLGTPLLGALIAGQGLAGLAVFVAVPALVGLAAHQRLARNRSRAG